MKMQKMCQILFSVFCNNKNYKRINIFPLMPQNKTNLLQALLPKGNSLFLQANSQLIHLNYIILIKI